MRELQLNVRFSTEELARLDFLATHYGISRSSVLRMILREEQRRLIAVGELRPGAAPPPPAVKRKRKP